MTDVIDTTEVEVSISRRDSVRVFRIASAKAIAPAKQKPGVKIRLLLNQKPRTSEPRKEEDMLKFGRYLVVAAQVEKVAQRLDVQGAAENDGEEGPENEPKRPQVLGKGEDRDTDVGE